MAGLSFFQSFTFPNAVLICAGVNSAMRYKWQQSVICATARFNLMPENGFRQPREESKRKGQDCFQQRNDADNDSGHGETSARLCRITICIGESDAGEDNSESRKRCAAATNQ